MEAQKVLGSIPDVYLPGGIHVQDAPGPHHAPYPPAPPPPRPLTPDLLLNDVTYRCPRWRAVCKTLNQSSVKNGEKTHHTLAVDAGVAGLADVAGLRAAGGAVAVAHVPRGAGAQREPGPWGVGGVALH